VARVDKLTKSRTYVQPSIVSLRSSSSISETSAYFQAQASCEGQSLSPLTTRLAPAALRLRPCFLDWPKSKIESLLPAVCGCACGIEIYWLILAYARTQSICDNWPTMKPYFNGTGSHFECKGHMTSLPYTCRHTCDVFDLLFVLLRWKMTSPVNAASFARGTTLDDLGPVATSFSVPTVSPSQA
jgi:hypothetical protein